MILLTEGEFLALKHQMKQEAMKELEEALPDYKRLADKVFREKFRTLFLPDSGYTPQLANLENKIKSLTHEIRKRRHPEHKYQSAPPIRTKEEFEEAVVIYNDLLEFLADHFEMHADPR